VYICEDTGVHMCMCVCVCVCAWTCVWTVVFPGIVLTSSTVLLCASLDVNECFEFLWSGMVQHCNR